MINREEAARLYVDYIYERWDNIEEKFNRIFERISADIEVKAKCGEKSVEELVGVKVEDAKAIGEVLTDRYGYFVKVVDHGEGRTPEIIIRWRE